MDLLDVWQDAHAGIKRHVYRGSDFQHPHYIQTDLTTGAARAFWIDSLSAFYPGLLALAGEVEEAIETHLLYTALWTRYSALPERWNTGTGTIDSGLRWWGGRPEFIESTWYIYRATQDPWYLYVGEMVLNDIRKRCWTECGWAGLEDVRTGELKDRMESFFLGETAKYLFLLFDPDHPLNHLDSSWVFTTEGHPLVVPRSSRSAYTRRSHSKTHQKSQALDLELTCPVPPKLPPFTIAATPGRSDFFHAASLARLHLVPAFGGPANSTLEYFVTNSSNNHTFYPWTLPQGYLPYNGSSSKLKTRVTFDLSFPPLQGALAGPLSLNRVDGGVMVRSISGLKLGMTRETIPLYTSTSSSRTEDIFRVHAVSQLMLGRDEDVLIAAEAVANLNPVDPYFTRHREAAVLDVVLDVVATKNAEAIVDNVNETSENSLFRNLIDQLSQSLQNHLSYEDLARSAQAILQKTVHEARPSLPAMLATGIGAGALPDVPDSVSTGSDTLTWTKIYTSDESCEALPADVAREYQVIVMKRGECSFNTKLRSIPGFAPAASSLQLVIVVSYSYAEEDGEMIRPLLDELQYSSGNMLRRNQVPMLLVDGGPETYEMLSSSKSLGLRRRYHFSSQGLRISNLHIV